MKKRLALYLCVFLLLPCAGCSPSDSDPDTPASMPASETGVKKDPTPEFKLATIQKGFVTEDDPLVHEFSNELDALQQKSESTREQIANLTVVTHDIMQKRGIDESYLSILQHVNQSIPDNVPQGRHLADVFAAYATLRIPR